MKNLLTLIIAILICMDSCNYSKNYSKISQADSLKKAINDSLIKAKSDSTVKAEAERQAYLNRPWKLGTFSDNFGDKTNEKYIETQVDGSFSNSATSDSYLFAEVLLKKNGAGIFLHEYNKSGASEKFIGNAQVQMKNSDGKKLVINTSKEWNHSGGILIENFISNEFSNFKSFIKNSKGEIKVVIFDDYSSVYQFTIDATGFAEEFSKL